MSHSPPCSGQSLEEDEGSDHPHDLPTLDFERIVVHVRLAKVQSDPTRNWDHQPKMKVVNAVRGFPRRRQVTKFEFN